MTNSRAKGIRGELECRDLIRTYGFDARRGQQYAGGGDSPDIVHSIPGLHIEVKRTETLSVYKALDQSWDDAAAGDTGVVFHKRNGKSWVVVLDAHDFLLMVRRIKDHEKVQEG